MPRWWVVMVLVALTACTGPDRPRPEDTAPGVAARTSWVLSHTVRESGDLRVTGGTLDHYSDSSSVRLGVDAFGHEADCSVTVYATGQGGPETMVGDKVPATVDGRPGFRHGAGAEGAYLMWQHDGRVWTQVSCDQDRDLDAVAAAVVHRPTPLRLPFGLTELPGGYGLAIVSTRSETGAPAVYLGRFVPAFGHPEADIVITYPFEDQVPTGRPVTVQGRPAVLDENREAPSVCVSEQRRFVCVRSYLSDTGPYPDRRGEIPTLTELAEALRFAPDLGDPATWLSTAELPS